MGGLTGDVTIYTLDRDNAEAVNDFIKQNINLVRKIAYKYKIQDLDFEDLVQEGCIGLYTAIMRFDTSTGYQFSTYAYPMISGAILRYIRDKGNIVRIPRRVYDIYLKYKKLKNEYDLETIIEKLSLTDAELQEIEQAEIILNNIRLDSKPFENSDDSSQSSVHNILQSNVNIEKEVIDDLTYKELINHIEDRLGKPGVTLAHYRELGYTQSEIASKQGVSQAQISRKLKKLEHVLLEKVKVPEIPTEEKTKLKIGVDIVSIREKHSKEITVVKKWLLENPGKLLEFNTILKANGLEPVTKRETYLQEIVKKELKEEGHILKVRKDNKSRNKYYVASDVNTNPETESLVGFFGLESASGAFTNPLVEEVLMDTIQENEEVVESKVLKENNEGGSSIFKVEDFKIDFSDGNIENVKLLIATFGNTLSAMCDVAYLQGKTISLNINLKEL